MVPHGYSSYGDISPPGCPEEMPRSGYFNNDYRSVSPMSFRRQSMHISRQQYPPSPIMDRRRNSRQHVAFDYFCYDFYERPGAPILDVRRGSRQYPNFGDMMGEGRNAHYPRSRKGTDGGFWSGGGPGDWEVWS